MRAVVNRTLPIAALLLLSAHQASAFCRPGRAPVYYYAGPPAFGPAYAVGPAVWGAPTPKPLPPVPVIPPPRAGVKEETDGPKAPTPRTKDKEPPTIPKTKLPLPGDPAEKKVLPEPKAAEPRDAAKRVEEFVVPSTGKRAEPAAEVKVGFFNHSERAIVLDVNGEVVKLPSGEYVTLRLPRTFKWAEKGQKSRETSVPADADGIEIVFRR